MLNESVPSQEAVLINFISNWICFRCRFNSKFRCFVLVYFSVFGTFCTEKKKIFSELKFKTSGNIFGESPRSKTYLVLLNWKISICLFLAMCTWFLIDILVIIMNVMYSKWISLLLSFGLIFAWYTYFSPNWTRSLETTEDKKNKH